MIYRIRFVSHSIHSHIAMSSCSFLTTCPTPSTCPETMCPPRRVFRVRALSRFTFEPTCSFAIEVLLIVSGITSALNHPFPSAAGEISVTVRHTPLVQMLSPILVSSSTLHASMQNVMLFAPRRTFFIRPISSTIPVNIIQKRVYPILLALLLYFLVLLHFPSIRYLLPRQVSWHFCLR